MPWTEVLLAAGPIAGGLLGYLAATRAVERQAEHDRTMENKRLKRETVSRFAASVLRWSETLHAYLVARQQHSEDLSTARAAAATSYREMTDGYSVLLLVGSKNLVERIAEVYNPARDAALDLVKSHEPGDPEVERKAVVRLRNAIGELLNDFRSEAGEPTLEVIEAAARSVHST